VRLNSVPNLQEQGELFAPAKHFPGATATLTQTRQSLDEVRIVRASLLQYREQVQKEILDHAAALVAADARVNDVLHFLAE